MAHDYNVIFMDGFDMYNFGNTNSTNPGVHSKWVMTQAAGIGAAPARYGNGQSLHIGDSLYVPTMRGYFTNNTYYQTMTVGFALYSTNVPTIESQGRFFNFMHDQGDQFGISASNIGALRLWRGGTMVAESVPNLIKTADWHYFEMEYVGNSTTGRATLYLDGVQVTTFTGNTQNQAPYGANGIQISGGSDGGLWIDDLYVIDQPTRIGERRIDTLRPNGDITGNSFAPSTTGANYLMLNEATVDASNYVTSNVLGAKDLYNFDNLTTVPTVIDAVQLSVWAQKTDSDTRQMATIFHSNTSETTGPVINLPGNHIDMNRIENLDPATNAAWTAAGVNALQAGYKIIK